MANKPKAIVVKVSDVDKSVRAAMPAFMKIDGDSIKIDPAFVARDEDDAVLMFADQVYPAYLKELKMSVDRFSVEVARRCATEDLTKVLGKPLHVRIVNADDFALKKLKEREGIEGGKSAAAGSASFRNFHTQITKARSAKK